MYTKDGIRSNETKQQGRWSDELYRIHSRQTFANAPPVYELVLVPGFAAPANFKTRNVNGVLVSVYRARHFWVKNESIKPAACSVFFFPTASYHERSKQGKTLGGSYSQNTVETFQSGLNRFWPCMH